VLYPLNFRQIIVELTHIITFFSIFLSLLSHLFIRVRGGGGGGVALSYVLIHLGSPCFRIENHMSCMFATIYLMTASAEGCQNGGGGMVFRVMG